MAQFGALFRPILAGATTRDRIVACFGAAFGIGLTGWVGHLLLPDAPGLALMLVPPMGASAVLLFAVPASPLARPWSIVGGSVVSALVGVGVGVGQILPDPVLGGAVAVGLAIAAMSLARCLHAPGGAVALIGVIGGPAVAEMGFRFALWPVGLNAVTLVAAGWLFHRVSGQTYPHVTPVAVPVPAPAVTPASTPTIADADIDAALADFGGAIDVGRDDLKALMTLAATHARDRATSG